MGRRGEDLSGQERGGLEWWAGEGRILVVGRRGEDLSGQAGEGRTWVSTICFSTRGCLGAGSGRPQAPPEGSRGGATRLVHPLPLPTVSSQQSTVNSQQPTADSHQSTRTTPVNAVSTPTCVHDGLVLRGVVQPDLRILLLALQLQLDVEQQDLGVLQRWEGTQAGRRGQSGGERYRGY